MHGWQWEPTGQSVVVRQVWVGQVVTSWIQAVTPSVLAMPQPQRFGQVDWPGGVQVRAQLPLARQVCVGGQGQVTDWPQLFQRGPQPGAGDRGGLGYAAILAVLVSMGAGPA